MNFDLTEEQQILVDSVSRFVKNDSGTERFRKLRASERGWEPSMWERNTAPCSSIEVICARLKS